MSRQRDTQISSEYRSVVTSLLEVQVLQSKIISHNQFHAKTFLSQQSVEWQHPTEQGPPSAQNINILCVVSAMLMLTQFG